MRQKNETLFDIQMMIFDIQFCQIKETTKNDSNLKFQFSY